MAAGANHTMEFFQNLRVIDGDHQHFPCPLDGGIVEDVAKLTLDHLHGSVSGQRQVGGIFLPIGSGEDGMAFILLQNLLHQGIQNLLLALEMAVEGCLANAHRVRDLGDGGGFKPLYRK